MQKERVNFRRAEPVLFRRLTALFLSFSQILFSLPAYPADIPKSGQLNPPGIQVELKIPERLGSLEEFHTAKCGEFSNKAPCSEKTVIYIQDAHDSLEAQINISKLIHWFVERYGVKTVLEEGYEGPVPTDQYFGEIKDPKVRQKVAYFLMDKLRLGGAEYAHITRFNTVARRSLLGAREKEESLRETRDERRDFNLIGADSLLLHRKNIERYQESEKYREETGEDLRSMDAEIRKMTQMYFTHKLKDWMSFRERFDRKELDLLSYLKRTQTLFLKGIGFEEFRTAYPNISLLLSAAETKDERLLSKLKTSVDYRAMFKEINRLEDDYAHTHLTQKRDQKVFRYYKMIQLLRRLNAIEVTEEEYSAVKETLQKSKTSQIARFIARESHQSVVLSKLWETRIQSAIDFYEVARERDGSIQSRLKDYAEGDDSAPIVLVYGGFHKGRVKELLEQNKFSYAVVSPKISAISTKHQNYYRQLMSMGYNSMALPKLAATATSPPRILEFGVAADHNDNGISNQLNLLSALASKDHSRRLSETIQSMDLTLSQGKYLQRSEVRGVQSDLNQEKWRDGIVAGILAPLSDENNIQKLTVLDAAKNFGLFRDAIATAPGMAEFFAPMHLEMLYVSLGDDSYQAQFQLSGGLILTIVSLLRTEASNRRTQIFKVNNPQTGVEKVVGYMNYSVIQSSVNPKTKTANIGFDIFIPYRGGRDDEIPISSSEIFLDSLRMIKHFNSDIESIEVRTGSQLRDHWSGKKAGEGIQIGKGHETARFYLREGFYPPGFVSQANRMVNRREGVQAMKNGALDQLISAHEVWHLPLSGFYRSEVRSARSEMRNPSDEKFLRQYRSSLLPSSKTFGSLEIVPPYLRHGAMVPLVRAWHKKNPGKKLLIFNVDSHADNYGRGGDWDSEWVRIVEKKGWADVIQLPSFYDETRIRVTPGSWDTARTRRGILDRLRAGVGNYAEIWGTVDYDFFSLLQPYLEEGEDHTPLSRMVLDAFHLNEPARETEIALLAKFFSDHQIKLSKLIPVISQAYLNLPENENEIYVDSVSASLQRQFGELGLKQKDLSSILNSAHLYGDEFDGTGLEAEMPYALYRGGDMTLLVRHAYKTTADWGDRGYEHRVQTADKIYKRLSDWAAYKHWGSVFRVLTADYGDRNHLLSEVLSNALKAVEETKTGDGLVSIVFGSAGSVNYFEISDQGRGISEKAWETYGLEKGTYRPRGREGVGVGIVRSFRHFLRTTPGASVEILSRRGGAVRGYRYHFDQAQGQVVRFPLEAEALRTLNPKFSTSLMFTFAAARSEARNLQAQTELARQISDDPKQALLRLTGTSYFKSETTFPSYDDHLRLSLAFAARVHSEVSRLELPVHKPLKVLVFGAGSGVDSMMLLNTLLRERKVSGLQLDLADIDPDAIRMAQHNLEQQAAEMFSSNAGRFNAQGDLILGETTLRARLVVIQKEFDPLDEAYDLILWNAPETMQDSVYRHVADHIDLAYRIASRAELMPFSDLTRITQEFSRRLNPQGTLLMEFQPGRLEDPLQPPLSDSKMPMTFGQSLRNLGLDYHVIKTAFDESTPVKERRLIAMEKKSTANTAALVVDSRMPLSYFLKAFGFDLTAARVVAAPNEGEWGRVPLPDNPVSLKNARQSVLRVMVSKKFTDLKGLSLIINSELENPDSRGTASLYLLTYQSVPAALVWPLPGGKAVLYYPFLTRDNGAFFKTTLEQSVRAQDRKAEILNYLRGHHAGPVLNVLENPYYDDNPFSYPSIHLGDELSDGFSFPSIYVPSESSTETLVSVFDQIEFSGKSIVDVGSGNGRLLVEAAQRGTAEAIGLETSEIGIQNTLAWANLNGVTQVKSHLDSYQTDYPTADIYLFNSPNIISGPASSEKTFGSQTYEEARRSNIEITEGDFRAVIKKIADAMKPDSQLYLRSEVSESQLASYLSSTGLKIADRLKSPIPPTRTQGSVYVLEPVRASQVSERKLPVDAKRSEVRNKNDEELYQVDEDDKVLGTVTRGQAHSEPYPIFRAVDIFPVTAAGEIVLQRRALYRGAPGLIDLTGGHVKYGQTYEEAGLEEASQELPFSIAPDRLKAVSPEGDSIFKTRSPMLNNNRQVFVVPMSESETQSIQQKNSLLKKFWDEIYQRVGKTVGIPPAELRSLAMEASREDLRAAIKKALIEKAGSEDLDFYEMEEYILMPLDKALELYKSHPEQFADGFYSLLDPQVNQAPAAEQYSEILKQAITQSLRSEVRANFFSRFFKSSSAVDDADNAPFEELLNMMKERNKYDYRDLEHEQRKYDFIKQAMLGQRGTALLLGFGKGEGYPLEDLANQFDKIIITDLDPEDARVSVAAVITPELMHKFVFLPAAEGDLTGILPQFAKLASEIVRKNSSSEKAITDLAKLLRRIKLRSPALENYKSDFVISSLVWSQLVTPFQPYVEKLFKEKFRDKRTMWATDSGIDWNSFYERLDQKHLPDLFRWVKPGGKIVLIDTPNKAYIVKKSDDEGYEKVLGANTLLSSKDLQRIPKFFKVEKKEAWYWVPFREEMTAYHSRLGFEVAGFILTPLEKKQVPRRSEVRTIPEDLAGLMPPLETVTLQPLDGAGRQTILQLNKNSFAEHFSVGSRNFEALREALTKNYERRANQRSLFIDLPEPFVVNGRRWVGVQLKGTVFDSRRNVMAHTEAAYKALGEEERAKGFVADRLEVFPDGRIENVGAQPSPDGAMTLDKAIREFALSASINENKELASKNLFAPGAIAYGEFPGLFFNGQPLGFVALGIDEDMTGAVTRLDENSDTVAADVTRALRLLHQENYSHPFLHGGNLSSNSARTKWYVHDLDASRLFDAKTDNLSFASAAQIRDFFYIIEKYVFDRYLSSSNPDAAAWGYRSLESILGAYFSDREKTGPRWKMQTGYLISGEKPYIDGGIEEVVEHYLQQLEQPGMSVVFRDILMPRQASRPLFAAAGLGAYIQFRLRRQGFNDVIRRSEVRSFKRDFEIIAELSAELDRDDLSSEKRSDFVAELKRIGDELMRKGSTYDAILAYLAAGDRDNVQRALDREVYNPGSFAFFQLAITEKTMDRFMKHKNLFQDKYGYRSVAYELFEMLQGAHLLAHEYDFGVGAAKQGTHSASIFSLYGLPVAMAAVHKKGKEFSWLDRVNPELIRGKRIIVFENDVITGGTLKKLLKEIKKFKPASVDLFLNLNALKGPIGIGSKIENIPRGFDRVITPEQLNYSGFTQALEEGESRLKKFEKFEKLIADFEAYEEMVFDRSESSGIQRDFFRRSFMKGLSIVSAIDSRGLMSPDEFQTAANTLRSLFMMDQMTPATVQMWSEFGVLKKMELSIRAELGNPLLFEYKILRNMSEHYLLQMAQDYYQRHADLIKDRPVPLPPTTSVMDAFRTAKEIVDSGEIDLAVAVGTEGFGYAGMFEMLGMKVLDVDVDEYSKTEDRPYRELDDLSEIKGKNIVLIEDDVQTGKTLEKVIQNLKRYGPQSISVYLGLPESYQTVSNVPADVRRTYTVKLTDNENQLWPMIDLIEAHRLDDLRQRKRSEVRRPWEATGGLLSRGDLEALIQESNDVRKLRRWRYQSSLAALPVTEWEELKKNLVLRGVNSDDLDRYRSDGRLLNYSPTMELEDTLIQTKAEQGMPLFYTTSRMVRQTWTHEWDKGPNYQLWQKMLDVADKHQVVAHGTWGNHADRHGYLMRSTRPYQLHWAMLAVMIEGQVKYGDAGFLFPDREYNPLNAADYGPYYVIFPLGYKNLNRDRSWYGFGDSRSQPSERQDHRVYLVPVEETRQFFIKALDAAQKFGFLDAVTAESEKNKILTYAEWIELDPQIPEILKGEKSPRSFLRSEVRSEPLDEMEQKKPEEIMVSDEDVDLEEYRQVMRSAGSSLTHQEEAILFRALHARNLSNASRKELYDFLVVQYLPFIRYMIRKLGRNKRGDPENVVQDGSLGLMTAVIRFDYRVGVRFYTYAGFWIRSFIQRGSDEDALGRLPEKAQELVLKIFKARQVLVQRLQREPSTSELAEDLKIDEDRLIQVLSISSRGRSLDAPLGDDDSSRHQFYADSKAQTPDKIAEKKEDAENEQRQILDALGILSPREQLVIKLRFGIGTQKDNGYTLEEVGDMLAVTRERIRQIEAAAIEKMQRADVTRAGIFEVSADHSDVYLVDVIGMKLDHPFFEKIRLLPLVLLKKLYETEFFQRDFTEGDLSAAVIETRKPVVIGSGWEGLAWNAGVSLSRVKNAEVQQALSAKDWKVLVYYYSLDQPPAKTLKEVQSRLAEAGMSFSSLHSLANARLRAVRALASAVTGREMIARLIGVQPEWITWAVWNKLPSKQKTVLAYRFGVGVHREKKRKDFFRLIADAGVRNSKGFPYKRAAILKLKQRGLKNLKYILLGEETVEQRIKKFLQERAYRPRVMGEIPAKVGVTASELLEVIGHEQTSAAELPPRLLLLRDIWFGLHPVERVILKANFGLGEEPAVSLDEIGRRIPKDMLKGGFSKKGKNTITRHRRLAFEAFEQHMTGLKRLADAVGVSDVNLLKDFQTRLSEDQTHVLAYEYGLGVLKASSQEEIREKLGFPTAQRVRNLKREAINRLRRQLVREGSASSHVLSLRKKDMSVRRNTREAKWTKASIAELVAQRSDEQLSVRRMILDGYKAMMARAPKIYGVSSWDAVLRELGRDPKKIRKKGKPRSEVRGETKKIEGQPGYQTSVPTIEMLARETEYKSTNQRAYELQLKFNNFSGSFLMLTAFLKGARIRKAALAAAGNVQGISEIDQEVQEQFLKKMRHLESFLSDSQAFVLHDAQALRIKMEKDEEVLSELHGLQEASYPLALEYLFNHRKRRLLGRLSWRLRELRRIVEEDREIESEIKHGVLEKIKEGQKQILTHREQLLLDMIAMPDIPMDAWASIMRVPKISMIFGDRGVIGTPRDWKEEGLIRDEIIAKHAAQDSQYYGVTSVSKILTDYRDMLSSSLVKRHIRRSLLGHVPELREGLEYNGERLDADSLTEKVLQGREFSFPGYYDDYITRLRTFAGSQSKAFVSSNYRSVPKQASGWAYGITQSEDISALFDQGRTDRDFSGLLLVHQTKDSLEMLEAMLTVDYIIPAEVFNRLNKDNHLTGLIKSGTLKSLMIPTEFIHFAVGQTVSYQKSLFAFVYPAESLLENQAFMSDPLATDDWAATGFTGDLKDPSYRIPVSSGVILIPAELEPRIKEIFQRVKKQYPQWEAPRKIFFYHGSDAREGLEELKQTYHLGQPSAPISISRSPVVVRTLPGSTFKSDDEGLGAISVLAIKALSGLARQEDVTRWSTAARRALLQFISELGLSGGAVNLYGSGRRGTYTPQQMEFPGELDFMARYSGVWQESDIEKISNQFETWLQNSELLPAILGTGKNLKVRKEIHFQYRGARQVAQFAVFANLESNYPVLKVDVDFYSQENSEERMRYDQKFDENLEAFISRLPAQYHADAKHHVLLVIRELKRLFQKHRLYDRADGGFRGPGVEQLALQAFGAQDKFGTPRPAPFEDLNSFLKGFRIETVMGKICAVIFEDDHYGGIDVFKRNLSLWDPGAKEPRDLAADVTSVALQRLIDMTIQSYPAAIPRRSEVRTEDSVRLSAMQTIKPGAVGKGTAKAGVVKPLAQSDKTYLAAGRSRTRRVLFSGDIQFQSRRQDKKVQLTPDILSSLQDMTRLARKHDVELEAKIYLKNGKSVGIEYPDDDTRLIIFKSLSQDEIEVTENFNFYFLVGDFLSRLYEEIHHRDSEEVILQSLRNLGFMMREENAVVQVYSRKKGQRILLLPSLLEHMRSLAEAHDLLEDIAQARYVANPWWSSVRLDQSVEPVPEHDEIMTVHTHPKNNPSPPSAFVRGKDKFGDIYHWRFLEGQIMGIILDTPQGDRLVLFHEPELTPMREAAYHGALDLYWNAKDANGSPVVEWKPEEQTYTTSKNWASVLIYLDQNLSMLTTKSVWLTKRVAGENQHQLFLRPPRISSAEQARIEGVRRFGDGFEHQRAVWRTDNSIKPGLANLRSEVRRTETISHEQSAGMNVPRLSLKQIIEKAGPTKVFVDAAAPVESPEKTAGELSRLAKAGAEVVIYNLAKVQNGNELVKILGTFPKALFHSVTGSWSDALAGAEHVPDEMNLVHYSEREAEAKKRAPSWARQRVIYLAGKSGSAAYGLSQVKALRSALEASELKESLLAQLEIAEKNGFYFVSEAKSAWMRLQLEAESIVAFAQAA